MDDADPLVWQMILQLVLIACNAVFACAEIAIISINDAKLDKMAAQGDKRAQRLLHLTKQPANFLATIQVGITLAGFLGSAFAADNFANRLAGWLSGMNVPLPYAALRTASVVIITIILSCFTLVLGELVPKRVAMRKAESIGLAMSGFIAALSKLFAPLVWLLTKSTNALLRLLGIDPNAEDDEVTEEEIRLMVDAGSEKGTIDNDEREFINNIFEFDDKTAVDLMTHRTDVTLLWLEEDDEAWAKTIQTSRYSMYPICGESVDDIVGVLNTKYYFRLSDKSRENVMQQAVTPGEFVPETVRCDTLLANMKRERKHFAIVLDEYGGMSGIITINDLLEALVGDLEDDASEPEETPEIEALENGTWCINGVAEIEEVEKALGVVLPHEDYDTFSGMVFSILGSVPPDGSTPSLDAFGLSIKVMEIKDHRLEKAIVQLIQEEDTRAIPSAEADEE